MKGVIQVLDQGAYSQPWLFCWERNILTVATTTEEEIAIQEFAKFEEKLKQQKGIDAVPSTVGKGSLDTVPG